jgi:hypothetical protein
MILQLRIALVDIKPVIYRKLQVDASITFYELHHTLQIAFGWRNCHLFHFKIGRRFIGIEDDFEESDLADKLTLGEILKENQKFSYEYDFGDSWLHQLNVSKITQPESGVKYPICIGGARKCPPEDCGGTSGYEELLAILKNKKHSQYYDLLNWLGGTYDPEAFDIQIVNLELSKLNETNDGRKR